ncbi:adhesive domain-containing protein [Latilactobacillus curvatus]
MNQNRVQASEVAPRAGLADISILANASLTSVTGTDMTSNAQGNYDLALKYSGTGLASVGVADKKVLVYALPAELQGKVVGGATVDIDANLLPITPGDIPGVSLLFGALGTAIDGVDKLVAIPAVKAAFDSLSTIQNLGAYQETLPATVSPDGKTISVDFTQGFGKYVHQAYVVDCKINPNAVRTKKISFL